MLTNRSCCLALPEVKVRILNTSLVNIILIVLTKCACASGVRARLRACAPALRVSAVADGMCVCESVRKECVGRAWPKGVRGEPSPRLLYFHNYLYYLIGSAVKYSLFFKAAFIAGTFAYRSTQHYDR